MTPLLPASASVRERLLQTLVARLTPAAQAMGGTVHRSPATPLTPEQCPALLVFAEADGIVERSNDRVTRELTVRIVALASTSFDGVRLEEGSDAEAMADQLLVLAHAALFADVNFAGLALGLKELDVLWELDEAEVSVCAIPARYCISYRTLLHDLTQIG